MQDKELNAKEIHPLSDFGFPMACHSIAISQNGSKVAAIGVYKPTIKLFDLKAASIKFERHVLSDPLKILSLEENCEKFSVLRSDRAVEFHTKAGLQDMLKTPSQPKDMIYNPVAAELYLGGNYNEIYRFNMAQGRFLKGIPFTGVRMSWSHAHGLLGAISKNSLVFIDTRSKTDVFRTVHNAELLSISQDSTGLKYAVGNEIGEVKEYDFRSIKPLNSYTFGSFIQKIEFAPAGLVAAAGTKLHLIKENTASIDVGFQIYDFVIDNGLLMIGGENPEIKTLLCDAFGTAPAWTV